ncbi:MAG: alpha/beta fold hydrolase [Primorskyibacter sp.]
MLKAALILIVGLAALWGITLWKAARNEARAEARFPPEGQILVVGEHPVHYVQTGTGPDVVLIHGASGNTRDMTFALSGALAARGYRVTVFDRPGLGYTPAMSPTGDTLADQASLLAQAAATLDLRTPIVVGQSYGGAVALAWGLDHPAGGLVLLAAVSQPWRSGLSLLYKVTSHPVWGPLVIPVLTAWVPNAYLETAIEAAFVPQSAPKGYAEHIGASLTLRRASMRANGIQRAQLLEMVRAQQPRYGALSLPIEILHGDADDTVPHSVHAEPLAKQIPHARLTLLPGIGHMPHHVAQPAVLEAVDRAADAAGLR